MNRRRSGDCFSLFKEGGLEWCGGGGSLVYYTKTRRKLRRGMGDLLFVLLCDDCSNLEKKKKANLPNNSVHPFTSLIELSFFFFNT